MLNLAQTRRAEAAAKLLQSFRDAAVEACFSPCPANTDRMNAIGKSILGIMTGETKLAVPAPKVEDFSPKSEAA